MKQIAQTLREIANQLDPPTSEPTEPGGEPEEGLDERGAMAKSVLTEYTRLAARQDGHVEGAVWDRDHLPTFGYPRGWKLQWPAGVEWVSTVSGNVWEPGVSGWREVSDGIPAWVQPTGAHDAYKAGDVTAHNGATWTSTVANNV